MFKSRLQLTRVYYRMLLNGEICVSTKRRINVSINNYRFIFFTYSGLETFFYFKMQFHPSWNGEGNFEILILTIKIRTRLWNHSEDNNDTCDFWKMVGSGERCCLKCNFIRIFSSPDQIIRFPLLSYRGVEREGGGGGGLILERGVAKVWNGRH